MQNSGYNLVTIQIIWGPILCSQAIFYVDATGAQAPCKLWMLMYVWIGMDTNDDNLTHLYNVFSVADNVLFKSSI